MWAISDAGYNQWIDCWEPGPMAAFLVLPFGDFWLDALSSSPHMDTVVSPVSVEYLLTSAKAFAQDVGVTMSDLSLHLGSQLLCSRSPVCIVRASQSGDLCVGSHLPGGIPNVIGERLWRREVLLEMYSVS
jgi:hypothetical protein